MNHKTICILLAFLVAGAVSRVFAQGTAFSYQGQLTTNGTPVTGPYDFEFTLQDTNANTIAGPETNLDVIVTSGTFTTTINFGAVFTGSNYWLSIGVRTNGNATNTFTTLTPRQPILPVPYAIFANTASNLLGTVQGTQVMGALPSGDISGTYSSTVNFTNSTNSFTGTYFGNGSGLANLSGSQISTGTVADAFLATNVAYVNSNQLFSGASSFTNRGNAFTGSFFGDGLVGWVAVTTNPVMAVANTGYILGNSNLVTVILPPTNSWFPGDVVRISDPFAGGWQAVPNTYYAIVGNYYSYNGAFWLQSSISAAANWHCMASASTGSPMYAGGSGSVLVSYDGGATWNTTTTTIPATSIFGVACSADGYTIYAGPNSGTGTGQIEKSTDGGNTWTKPSSTGANWNTLACSSSGSDVLAGATNGSLYFSSNGGTTLTTQSSPIPGTASWSAVTMSADGSHMAAAAYGGDIYYAVNGSWQNSTKSGDWTAMASSSDGLRLVACTDTGSAGNIYTSTNGGANWTQTAAPSQPWLSIACSADGSRIVAGINNNTIYASANFGVSWIAETVTNTPWSCLACSADGTKVIAGQNLSSGNIYHATIIQQYVSATTTNSIGGGGGSAVELLNTGNGIMPISSTGPIWAN